MKEVINMDNNNYELGYDCGMDDFAEVMDNFCLNVLREYEKNVDTHAKKDEMLNAFFWKGAAFALKVVHNEIERLNE
jgi:hypothetical protein